MYFIPPRSVLHPQRVKNQFTNASLFTEEGSVKLRFFDGVETFPLDDDTADLMIGHSCRGVILDPVYEYFDGQWRYGVGALEQHEPDGLAGDVRVWGSYPIIYMGKMYWKHVITGENGYDDVYVADPSKTYGWNMPYVLDGPIHLGDDPTASDPVGKWTGPVNDWYFSEWVVFSSRDFQYVVERNFSSQCDTYVSKRNELRLDENSMGIPSGPAPSGNAPTSIIDINAVKITLLGFPSTISFTAG